MAKTNIYIGVTQGISFYSKVIKWFQWGNPNTHIFYIYEEELHKEDPIILESIAGYGVHKDRLSEAHTPNTPYQIYSLKVTTKQKRIIEEYLEQQIGKSYDYRGLLGFASRKDTNDNNKLFCTELIYQALNAASVKIYRTLRPIQIYPSLAIESQLFKFLYSDKTIQRYNYE